MCPGMALEAVDWLTAAKTGLLLFWIYELMKKVFLFIALACLSYLSVAQQIPPEVLQRITPEMMQQFEGLSPGQQQMIATQLGIDVELMRNQVEMFSNAGDLTVGARGQPLLQMNAGQNEPGNDETGSAATMQAPQPEASNQDSVFMSPLPLFGTDIFDADVSTFVPVDNAPIPATYVLGPGDTINVQLYGSENRTLNLTVGRDGTVSFPDLGPVELAGLDFESARSLILDRISEEMIGVRGAVTLGRLRAINIFIVGEVTRPGTFSVSALSTVTQALFVAGGVTDIGSLRNIQVRRGSEIVSNFDTYDLLLRGDIAEDIRLQSGDVVYVPPAEAVAQISGAVRRPAAFEMLAGESLADLIAMAGGLRANAYSSDVLFRTFGERGLQQLESLNLNQVSPAEIELRDGDGIFVSESTPYIQDRITVRGAVTRPGPRGWRPGLRISDVFTSVVDDLKANDVDLNYALVVRIKNAQRNIEVLQFNLGQAILEPASDQNLELFAEDEILVFDLPNVSSEAQVQEDQEISSVELQESAESNAQSATREDLLRPLIRRLQLQANREIPIQAVTVNGDVKVPGTYPLVQGQTVSDLIRAAGGLNDSAVEQAELLRMVENVPGDVDVQQIELDLSTDVTSNTDFDFQLQSRDTLLVRTIADWNLDDRITLTGEVRFPGSYRIVPGETLADVIARAGGLKESAFVEGAVFTREMLKEREATQAREFADMIRSTFAARNMTQETTSTSFAEVSELATFFEEYEGIGRMVIDLDRIIQGDSSADLELLPGDTLAIPKRPESVTVVGAVHHEGSHRFNGTLDLRDYLELSGGATQRADDDAIYVLRADGSVLVTDRSRSNLLFRSSESRIGVGDTIVVPVDTSYKDRLTFIRDITQIAYQSAVSVAAIIAAFP